MAIGFGLGYYSPSGECVTDTDWATKDEAAARIHYLNGGISAVFDKWMMMIVFHLPQFESLRKTIDVVKK